MSVEDQSNQGQQPEDRSIVPSGGDNGLPAGLTVLGVTLATGLAAYITLKADRAVIKKEAVNQSQTYSELLGLDNTVLSDPERTYLNSQIALRRLQEPARRHVIAEEIHEDVRRGEEFLATQPQDGLMQALAPIREVAVQVSREIHLRAVETVDKITDARYGGAAVELAGKVAKLQRGVNPRVIDLANDLGRILAEMGRHAESEETISQLAAAARAKVEDFKQTKKQ